MNPIEGVNPHGLEIKKQIFHIIKNGVEVQVIDSKQWWKYCYATFEPMAQVYTPFWALCANPRTSVETAAQYNDAYNSGNVYYSKDYDGSEGWDRGSKHMVYGDAEYYYSYTSGGDGAYSIAFIIDTSGSMTTMSNNEHLYQTQHYMTSALGPFVRNENTIPDLYLYSGTYITNLTNQQQMLYQGSMNFTHGNTDLANLSSGEVFSRCNKIIRSIPKMYGTESMIACLYNVIDNFMSEKPRETFGSEPSSVKAMTFVVVTDEGFVSGTDKPFGNVDDLMTNSANNGKWLSSWQTNSHNPLPNPPPDSKGKKTMPSIDAANAMLNFCEAVSYYYGFNCVIGLTWLSNSSSTLNQWKYLKKYKYTSSSTDWREPIWDGSSQVAWHNPMDFMCQINFTNARINNTNLMSYATDNTGTKYDTLDNIKSKYHHTNNNAPYFKFKYPGESFTLPTIAELVITDPNWSSITKDRGILNDPDHQVVSKWELRLVLGTWKIVGVEKKDTHTRVETPSTTPGEAPTVTWVEVTPKPSEASFDRTRVKRTVKWECNGTQYVIENMGTTSNQNFSVPTTDYQDGFTFRLDVQYVLT